MSKVVYEGWMVRYGRRKIGRSFIHMRYFVLEPLLLAYYKKKPQDNKVSFDTFYGRKAGRKKRISEIMQMSRVPSIICNCSIFIYLFIFCLVLFLILEKCNAIWLCV